MYDDIIKNLKKSMQNTVNEFKERLIKIRAGRANASILTGITFDYYGVETPINQAATVNVPEPRLLTIKPWDRNNISSIEKAILKSDIGITPSNDGEVIRLPFPQPTEERRKELVKEVKSLLEEDKVSLRNQRRDSIDEVKKREKSGDLSEDQRIGAEEEIQKIIDKFQKELDLVAKEKEKELMEF
ncbi:MAG: ribosome recycling factor [Peptoniphilaceae bacterium]|nr:ribosome recycling factor [Peptoniphilaceae bacterium]MDD7382828.1 ribosome recycling factor [Peptoniphilaceae bacterium]MDY3738213.1 ribosome recycling factor [Peptoniphilaceae bacterium]